jgi:ABC-type Na+ efflux pump permease subunit
MKPSLLTDLRIIGAIAAKDITSAVKNKNVLANLITILFLMVFYKVMPTLVDAGSPPVLFVYDAGSSALISALEESDAVELRAYPSEELMKEKLAIKDDRELGLIIPADFDQQAALGEPVLIEAYVPYWVSDQVAREAAAEIESVIGSVTDHSLDITIAGIVYAPLGEGGQAFMFSILLALTVAVMGVIIIPHLMIEEKQAKTLDALLVSPASAGQVVVGKALTALFYCLITAAVVLAVNAVIVVHWWLMILAVICGALFPVALGLLFGVLFESRQQLTLWGFVSLQVLLVPTFLVPMVGLVPDGIIAVLRWVPTAALGHLFRVACSRQAPIAAFAPELALVLGSAGLVLAVVAWIVRRSDR